MLPRRRSEQRCSQERRTVWIYWAREARAGPSFQPPLSTQVRRFQLPIRCAQATTERRDHRASKLKRWRCRRRAPCCYRRDRPLFFADHHCGCAQGHQPGQRPGNQLLPRLDLRRLGCGPCDGLPHERPKRTIEPISASSALPLFAEAPNKGRSMFGPPEPFGGPNPSGKAPVS